MATAYRNPVKGYREPYALEFLANATFAEQKQNSKMKWLRKASQNLAFFSPV